MTGCSGFFVPLCQEYNTCTSTTTTGTTGTTATTAAIASTGGPITPSGLNSSYVYVANANNSTIGAFAIASGKLATIPSSTVTTPALPTAIAGTPNGKFLYLATSDGAIYLNTIANAGNLEAGNSGSPVATVVQPTWMSMDRTGNWLFVASSIAKDMREFQIDAKTGALHSVSQGPALDPGRPTEAYLTPDNHEMFVALGKGGVDAFPFDAATGTLGTRQHIAPLHAGLSADDALTTDTASRNLYVAEANAGIRVFTIGAGAILQEISGSPFGLAQKVPTSLAVDRSSGNLFVASSDSNTITEYSIAADGALAFISRKSSSTDSSPAALMQDKSGKFVVSTSKSAVPNLASQ